MRLISNKTNILVQCTKYLKQTCFQQIPAATTIEGLVCPHFGLGLGIGIVDSALVPMLANLVDTRHPNTHYGAVYALQQTAVSLAYSVGELICFKQIQYFIIMSKHERCVSKEYHTKYENLKLLIVGTCNRF